MAEPLSDWYTVELLFKATGEAEAEAFCDLVAEAVYGTPAHSGPLGSTGAAVSMTRHPVEDWQSDD